MSLTRSISVDEKVIIPRNVSFGISKNPTRHWFGRDVVKTALIDCLSIFLPEGERFFIRSLRYYLPQISDQGLKDEINGYSMQEAFHTREHQDYNQSLRDFGYAVDVMERPGRKALSKPMKPIVALVTTCAIEHLTLSYSIATLRCHELLDDVPAPYQRLWTWHAVEELEHSAVSLHVLEDVTVSWPAWKRYGLRVSAFNVVFMKLALFQFRNIARYARHDGVKITPGFWCRVMWIMFGKPGFVRLAIPSLLRYYLPGYKPEMRHYGRLLRRGRNWIGKELPELSADSSPIKQS